MSDLVNEPVDSLRPCIAELLRTGHHPGTLVLRVERILFETRSLPSSGSGNDDRQEQAHMKSWYRLLLSDGEYSIQAVVSRHFHHLLSTGMTREGSQIVLQDYSVQKTKRRKAPGRVAYICIEKYRNCLGSLREEPHLEHGENMVQPIEFESGLKRKNVIRQSHSESIRTKKHARHGRQNAGSSNRHLEDDGDSDAFETAQRPSLVHRREVLHKISGDLRLKWSADHRLGIAVVERHQEPDHSSDDLPMQRISPALGIAEEPQNRSESTVKLHTLASLLDPDKRLPRKNYLCKVFAVITWVSSAIVKRPGLPEKRHIKVHDPTVARRYSGISISVFVNARHFKPAVGTIALFTGLTAQKWDGEVILNAYEKDCAGNDWFITDQKKIEDEGLGFDGLREWWERRSGKG